MSELMMSSPHNLSYILYMKFWKFSFFFPDTGNSISLYQHYIRINIISHLFWVDIRQGLHSHSWNVRFLSFLYMKCVEIVRWWHHQLTLWIFIRTGQELFSEKMWNFKMSQLPYFLSDFHHVVHQSVGKFLLSLLKIMVILDWTSPLIVEQFNVKAAYDFLLRSTHQQTQQT